MTDETPRPNRRTLLASMALMAAGGTLPARAGGGAAMKHVVLLGDSVFDNKAYVGDGPDVIMQVSEALPSGWTATLAALIALLLGYATRRAQKSPVITRESG